MPIDKPLRDVLDLYCNVNSLELLDRLPSQLERFDVPILQAQLRDAIERATISPAEYEALTDDEYETQEELRDRFIEIWKIAFDTNYPSA